MNPNGTSGMIRFAAILAISGLVLAMPRARAGDPGDSGKAGAGHTVAEIIASADRAAINDLLAYVEAKPTAADAEQAYLTVFNKIIEHDWYVEYENRARDYLAKKAEGPVRPLARICAAMARAKAGDFPRALVHYKELMDSVEGKDQEEFAVNFADALAGAAMTAGEYAVARGIYDKLLERYGDNPSLKAKVDDDLARIAMVGKPAPVLAANDIFGKSMRLDKLRGKVVLVDFWATFAAPSIAELPRMQSLYAKYRDRGFEIVSVSLDETPDAVLDFVKTRAIPWRQIHNATSGADAVSEFGVSNIPATFLIDPEGRVIRVETRGKALEELLRKTFP